MDWKSLLKSLLEREYSATAALIAKVDEAQLGWKPSAENNWMTYGQLLHHLGDACGMLFVGFITGSWPASRPKRWGSAPSPPSKRL